MIKNERQYGITRTRATEFRAGLTDIEAHPRQSEQLHPLLRKAEQEALQSQLETLEAELAEYEDLRSGKRNTFALTSFDELPLALIKARIASGLTQRDLALRLGLKEQQIQKYEASDYASASLSRVQAVVRALGVTVKEEMSLTGRSAA